MKQKDIDFLMDIAVRAAQDSKAVRLKVGAVVTDSRGNFVASGYNGTIRGFHTNACEKKIFYRDETPWSFNELPINKKIYPYSDNNYTHPNYRLVTDEDIVIHAEQNVISHAARRGVSIDNGVSVLTHSPCSKCTSLLIQCGITEAIYKEKHRSFDETNDLYGSYIKLTQYKG